MGLFVTDPEVPREGQTDCIPPTKLGPVLPVCPLLSRLRRRPLLLEGGRGPGSPTGRDDTWTLQDLIGLQKGVHVHLDLW